MTHPAFAPEKSAVVTGAASGIGLAIARSFARQGMSVMLVDVDRAALDRASEEVEAASTGGQTASAVADVASFEDMKRVANATHTAFGGTDVLVNNAAITTRGGPWENLAEWQRSLDVNVWGALHGHAAFVPQMVAGGRPGAVVNLGSKAGITTPPGNAAYSVSKAAIKVLIEQRAHELRQLPGGRITAHLLVPGYTFTPMNFPGMTATVKRPPWTADQVAEALWDGVANGRFYIICPDNEVSSELDHKRIAWAAQDMIEGRPALSRWHTDYRAAFDAFAQDTLDGATTGHWYEG